MSKDDSNESAQGFHIPEGELDFHHHTELPDTAASLALDRTIGSVGKLISWLWLAVVAVILISVISRYVFGQGSIMLEELTWHIYGIAWPIGLAYTLVTDDHVRVDVLHERMALKTQAWIEVIGLIVLLLPFLGLVLYYSLPYAYDSFIRGETSQAPSGLPYRFLLKSIIPLSMVLLAVAVIARISRCTALLFGFPKPRRQTTSVH
ncbi:hypothetical protein KBTX_03885 [wastewater metagenome]|uniref:Tripartite ATP-independent periplasmic transporters DctQ component domain-containing protein n=2 Tax=unclassified sequences TaxID=12908 RepID=A0A5B8RKN3_9ZZZZ|nr:MULTISPECIES: TRAP transporter small permease subunit [Arhodomonas]MCS4502944.1 TRAP transporter small permease subunit [Arhodomonas aquaeolei]QEA07527.1 hypothetical protein KBTEX_03885 [uncultured organism]